MTSRPLHSVSEDCLTISPHKKQSMTSTENSFPIPIDLVMEILSTFPAKYVGRCRCVSKLWAIILCRPDFTELFLKKSFARPQLLVTCLKDNGLFIFSSHQPQNLNEISTAIDTTYLTHVPMTYQVCDTINGLLCLRGIRIFEGCKKPALALVLCNPTTGESLTLPKMKTKSREIFEVKSYFGYDPSEKLFKVLFMKLPMTLPCNKYSEEHQILTLGTENLSWRMITCCIPHRPISNGICINGVLYYTAVVREESLDVTMVVCFDFRYEEFSVMKRMGTFNRTLPNTATPINYNGKLGLLMTDESYFVTSGRSKCFELWVLEDIGKHEWSKRTFVLPPLWKTLVGKIILYFVGMIGTNEIVLSSYHPTMPYYVFYYNIERDTVKRVRIQGMEMVKGNGCRIFLNHLENVKLISNI